MAEGTSHKGTDRGPNHEIGIKFCLRHCCDHANVKGASEDAAATQKHYLGLKSGEILELSAKCQFWGSALIPPALDDSRRRRSILNCSPIFEHPRTAAANLRKTRHESGAFWIATEGGHA